MLKQSLGLLLLLFSVTLLFSACDRKKAENFTGTVMNMPQRAHRAAGAADLQALKSCVQSYRATNGRYPKNLKDAAALLDSPVDLSKYDYDPATGKVSLKNGG